MGGEVANGHMTVGGGGGGAGARQACHSGPVGPSTLSQLGPSGLPFRAHPSRHPWARPARHLGPSGPPSIKPVGLAAGLKKN